MAALARQELGTSTLLDVRASGWFGKRLGQAAARLARPRGGLPRSAASLREASRWGYSAGAAAGRISRSLIHLALLAVLAPLRLAAAVGTADGRSRITESLRRRSAAAVDGLTVRLRALPRSAQRLATVALLFGYLFVQSLVFLAERQSRDADVAAGTRLALEIQTQLDDAEMNIIFKDNERAAALLRSAESALAALPERTRAERRRSALLSQSLDELRTRLERVVTVPAPTALARAAVADPSGLLLGGGELLLYRADAPAFASVDRRTGAVTARAVTADVGRLRQSLADDRGRFIFLDERGDLAVLDLAAGALAGQTVVDPPAAAASFALYNGRLYILDHASRQVWRYQPTAGSYARRAPWLVGNTERIAGATGLVVDGDVYLLFREGTVEKFSNGAAVQTWRAQAPLTLARGAAALTSPPGSSSLYAFDRDSRRVFRWAKEDGRLAAQYVFPDLADLKGFAVDEAANALYLLNGSDVLTAPIVSDEDQQPAAAP
jgi:hypothetical protein